MKLSKEERETIIRASGADAQWDVWTDDPKMVRRFRAKGWPEKPKGDGSFFLLPLRAVTIRRRRDVVAPKARGRSL